MRKSRTSLSPLSLLNLVAAGTGSRYLGQSVNRFSLLSWMSPLKPAMLTISTELNGGKEKIVFSYAQGEEIKKHAVKISKEIVESAMQKPEALSNGRLGVYAAETKIFNSTLAGLPSAWLIINLMCGDGTGKEAVAMVFSNGCLEKLKIEQTYKGKTTTLFQAEDLKDERVIEKARTEARTEVTEKAEQEAKNNRFRF